MLAPIALLALLSAAKPAEAAAPPKPEVDAAWVARMDALAVSLAALLPEVALPAPTDAAARKARDERLRQHARSLAGLAHSMANSQRLPDSDPTVTLLSSQLQRSVDELQKRDGERLRDAAFVVAATCIGCHTRTARGAGLERSRSPIATRSVPSGSTRYHADSIGVPSGPSTLTEIEKSSGRWSSDRCGAAHPPRSAVKARVSSVTRRELCMNSV